MAKCGTSFGLTTFGKCSNIMDLVDIRLSQSKMSLYMRCPFSFKVTEGDKIVPRFTPAPLRKGTLVHAGFEGALRCEWYNRKILGDDASESQLLIMGEEAIRTKQRDWLVQDHIKPHLTDELRSDARVLCDDAVNVFKRSFPGLLNEWETVETPEGQPLIEYPLEIPLTRFAGLGGTLDWVARERSTGNVFLWDFKTGKQIQGEDYYDTHLQDLLYLYLLRRVYNLELVGSIKYQIRSEPCKEPKLNKNGTMSQKDIVSDWPTYRKALLRAGLNPDDYRAMKDKLDAKIMQRVDRYYRTKKEVEAVYVNCNGVADKINASNVTKTWPRNLNPFTCQGCRIRSYCLADLRGHDTEFLARTEYMREGEQPFYSSVEFLEDTDGQE